MGRRLVFVLHDPGMAILLRRARPGTPTATYGGAAERERLGPGTSVLVPPPSELTTRKLLEHPDVQALLTEEPSRIVTFKPSGRVERAAAALGADIALAPAGLAQRLENKLVLPALAEEAGVRIPAQRRVDVTPDLAWSDLGGEDVVVQSPRGFSGKKTFRIRDATEWRALRPALVGRPAKVSEYVEGVPGTLHAVVDSAGRVVVSAPIEQLTGLPELTPYPLGSCGNEFTWTATPHPGDDAAETARRLGRVLARRGYLGAFGLDFVVPEDGTCVLIEINPRLTASFALYASLRPRLLRDHLAALAEAPLTPTLLDPLPGGQLILHTLGDTPEPPLPPRIDTPEVIPHPATEVAPGSVRGRILTQGPARDALPYARVMQGWNEGL